MNLSAAYKNCKSKLTGAYLANVETEEGVGVEGEELVKMVCAINDDIKRIRAAIKIYGRDFKVPTRTEEIPTENKSLFFGCGNWVPLWEL